MKTEWQDLLLMNPLLFGRFLNRKYRLTRYRNQPFGELYDRCKDSLEQHIVIGDPAYEATRSNKRERLIQQMM